MRHLAKALIGVFLATYFVIAIVVGSAFGSIPAANTVGRVYVGATWPAWVRGSPLHIPLPAWAFTFSTEGEG